MGRWSNNFSSFLSLSLSLYYGYSKDQRHYLLCIQHIQCSNHQPWYDCLVRAVIPQLWKLYHRKVEGAVYLVQATYTIALLWFI